MTGAGRLPAREYNGGVAAISERRAELDDARLTALSEAAIAITSELSLDHVLQRIADIARELVGSRYAALGVADAKGRMRQFLTSGLTPEQRLAIGPLPRGL